MSKIEPQTPQTEPSLPPVPPQPRPEPRPARRWWWFHLLLFVLTFLSAMWSQLAPPPQGSIAQAIDRALADTSVLLYALTFAATLLGFLLMHELGHYLTARRYSVDQSLPYFVPAPTFVGTLGAVIVMRSQPKDRSVLMRVAAMGPYAGLLVALPAAAWGLANPLTDASMPTLDLQFGDSLVWAGLRQVFGDPSDPALRHPVALAGWVGLFVTSLNLIPAAQLDGGHIAYALLGRGQEAFSALAVVGLLGLGMFLALLGNDAALGWSGALWIFWALLLFVVGIKHPPVAYPSRPLRFTDKLNGWVAMAVFVVTFVPVPIKAEGWALFEADNRERPAIQQQRSSEEFRL